MYQLNSQLIEENLQPLAGHVGLGTSFIDSVLQSQRALSQQVFDQQQQLHKQLVKERDIHQVGEISKECAAQFTQSWLTCCGQLFQAVQDYGSASAELYRGVAPAVAEVSTSKKIAPRSVAEDTPKKAAAKKRVAKPARTKQAVPKVVDNSAVQASAAAMPKSAEVNAKVTAPKVDAKASERVAKRSTTKQSATAIKSAVSEKATLTVADKAPAGVVSSASKVSETQK